MAKRRKRLSTHTAPMETPPAQRKKWSAESMARTMMETDPRMKRMEDHISQAVMAAGEKALKTARQAK